jgi:hypothetical protein
VSLAFGQAARDAGIARSMGSKGDCYDNAVAESLFATLKKELVHRRSWPTRRELTSEAFEYSEAFYNRTRRHSTLGYLSPADYGNRTPIDGGTAADASVTGRTRRLPRRRAAVRARRAESPGSAYVAVATQRQAPTC